MKYQQVCGIGLPLSKVQLFCDLKGYEQGLLFPQALETHAVHELSITFRLDADVYRGIGNILHHNIINRWYMRAFSSCSSDRTYGKVAPSLKEAIHCLHHFVPIEVEL